MHDVNVQGILAFIEQSIRYGRRARILYCNAYLLNLAYGRAGLADIFRRAELVFCDGFGASLAVSLLYGRAVPRQTPPDWIDELADQAAKNDRSFFFLGAKPGVAERAADQLSKRHPALRIVGFHHGYFDLSHQSSERASVLRKINDAKPDILLIGFGMPLQEQWLDENWEELDVGVAMTVGALFDYMAGDLKRGSRWITDSGFEWLSRLVIEPKRLWRRYLLGLPLLYMRLIAFYSSHTKEQKGKAS